LTEPDLSPSPSRLVESLRDTGYSYEAAFADIVDNSIAASADTIEIGIEVSPFDNELSVTFFDNGEGMTERTYKRNALRF
jgi:signal transduction histidine kinase